MLIEHRLSEWFGSFAVSATRCIESGAFKANLFIEESSKS